MDPDPGVENSLPCNLEKSTRTFLKTITFIFIQCCGSGMFIPDPDFFPSRIPDPKTATKERGEKKNCHTFLCSHKFHKIVHYFSFEGLKEKIWASFQRIIELFTQKIVTKLSKIWIWDPGSGKNLFRIPVPGVKKAPDPGSGSATPFYAF
jgi:hypothetical protein